MDILSNLIEKLPTFKRVAVILNHSVKDRDVISVEHFKRSIPYDFLKGREIKCISPEIDSDHLPYLLVVLK